MGFLRAQSRDDGFYQLLADSAHQAVAAAEMLTRMLGASAEEREELAPRLKEIEHQADEATHAIIHKVNSSFVTPFDHSDIVELAAALDDCTDFIESVGQTVVLYRMDGLMPGVTAQMEVIVRMAELTADAMPRLATMKQLKDYWVEINRLENEGDAIYRGLLRDLFGGAVSDPIEVIKHKDIIERLEAERRVIFRYVDESGQATDEGNANGSMNNIAGIINVDGNVLGLMPHPERSVEALLGYRQGELVGRSSPCPARPDVAISPARTRLKIATSGGAGAG